ncbi:MAG: hypothetical protein S4CHLAM102_13900 [Chlamydiia bacterium]|nr:hypothetical protein [Chlamydiia bacterium]
MPVSVGRKRAYFEAFKDCVEVFSDTVDEEWVDENADLLKLGALDRITFVACSLTLPVFTEICRLTRWNSVLNLNLIDCSIDSTWGPTLAQFIAEHPHVKVEMPENALSGCNEVVGAFLTHHRVVNLSANELTLASLEGLESVVADSPTCSLDLSDNPELVKNQEVTPIILASKLTHLRYLELSYMSGGNSLAIAVNQYLKDSQVQFVGLRSNQINAFGAFHLNEFLTKNRNRTITIDSNPIGGAVQVLGPILMQRVDRLSLNHCRLNSEIMRLFVLALRELNSLDITCRHLDLSENKLHDGGGEHVIDLLNFLPALELNLASCHLASTLPTIFSHLVLHQQVINFSDNMLEDHLLAKMWQDNLGKEKRVVQLSLHSNMLTIESIEHLAKLLFCNPQMQKIDFHDNDFSDEPTDPFETKIQLYHLVEELGKRALTLDFRGTQIDAEKVTWIGLALFKHPHQVGKVLLSYKPDCWAEQPIEFYFPYNVKIVEMISA